MVVSALMSGNPTCSDGIMAECLVLDLKNFGKPMVLLLHDGNRAVPEPGVLFYAMEEFPTTKFKNERQAVRAVNASARWRKEFLLDSKKLDTSGYRIITVAQYDEEIRAVTIRIKKGKKVAQTSVDD